MRQLCMTGDDWLSDRDRKRMARAEAARHKAALACAAKLEGAATALNAYLRACVACEDDSDTRHRGAADSRLRLIEDLTEYSGWLRSKYRR